MSLEPVLQDKSRNDDGDERGKYDFADNAAGGNHAFDPEHDGGYVADGREGTAAVGSQDDERGINHAFLLLVYQFAQHHNHDDAGGQIVKDGREEESHECNAPEQFTLAGGLECIAHEVEAAVGVDNLDNGHGTHQEEEDFAGVAHVFEQEFVDEVGQRRVLVDAFGQKGGKFLGMEGSDKGAGVGHVEGPADGAHDEGRCCLVDF